MTANSSDTEKLVPVFAENFERVEKALSHKFAVLDGQMAALTEVVITLLNAAPLEVRARALGQIQESLKNSVDTAEAAKAFSLWQQGIKQSILAT